MSHEQVQEHIDLIARHEQEFVEKRTTSERVGDAVASFVGSLKFVVLHLLLFGCWMLWNSLPALKQWRFDAYPFAMLDTIVAMEAILLASFILMRQQRISRRADEREHLMLQVMLLTEKETTKILQINRETAQLLGLQRVVTDKEVASLSEETSLEHVTEKIRETLSTDEP